MKSFSIHIQEPCHENWDAMTPNEKGKFCGACAKTVVDFTNYSDEEIIGYFKKDKGNTCGRFTHNQLQQTYIPKHVYRGYFIKPLAAVALPLVLLTSCNDENVGKAALSKLAVDNIANVIAQVNNVLNAPNVKLAVAKPMSPIGCSFTCVVSDPMPMVKGYTVAMPFPNVQPTLMGDIVLENPSVITNDSAIIETYITIVNEQQQPIVNALVEDTTTKQQLFSDSLGKVAFKSAIDKNISLRISHKDFITKNIAFNDNNNTLIVMKKDDPVVITSYTKYVRGSVTMGATRIYGEHIYAHNDTTLNDNIKHNKQEKLSIYPNPITTAQLLHIYTQDLPTGNYMLELLNNAGLLMDKQFYLVNKQVLQYRFTKNHATGMYYIVLTHKDTKQRFTQQLVVTS
jgi:hypothetical protein